FLFVRLPLPLRPTLFPYTTLFRSGGIVQAHTNKEWLDWLTRVRLLMITLILGVAVVWPQYFPSSSVSRFVLPLIVFWVTLAVVRSEEHTSELQSRFDLVCRLLLEK